MNTGHDAKNVSKWQWFKECELLYTVHCTAFKK